MTDPRTSQVLELLERFEAGDPKESETARRMAELARSALDPFSRTHFSPGHFTASAFVLHPSAPAIALVFHGKLERWLQPGGHVDPSDRDVEQAARREIREEAGLAEVERADAWPGLLDVDIHEIPARGAEPAHQHFDLRFLFRASDAELETGSDANDSRWVGLDEVARLGTDASVLRAVARIRHLLGSA